MLHNHTNKLSFQRIGEKSNADVGRKFELSAQSFFATKDITLNRGHSIDIGLVNRKKKSHSFDLGCDDKKIIVECKSHRWTTGNNVPSAKMTVWNEAMYYFQLAPAGYRKIMFVLLDRNRKGESLAMYYINTYNHLIPNDVEFWEYDETSRVAIQIH